MFGSLIQYFTCTFYSQTSWSKKLHISFTRIHLQQNPNDIWSIMTWSLHPKRERFVAWSNTTLIIFTIFKWCIKLVKTCMQIISFWTWTTSECWMMDRIEMTNSKRQKCVFPCDHVEILDCSETSVRHTKLHTCFNIAFL